MRAFIKTRGGRVFLRVWAGQLVSNIGSAMTSFGLGIWVFLETGSAMQLAFIVLAARMPMLLVSPFAGALVDRWDRRWAMIISDAGAALGTLITALLLLTNSLEIWHLYLTLSLSGLFQAFQFPAYSAATTLLVPKDQYTRASGLVQLAGSIGRVAAPSIAAVIVVTGGLSVLFVIDFLTFLVAVGALTTVRFPAPARQPRTSPGVAGLMRDAYEGWQFVATRRGLVVLLLSFSLVNFAFAFQSVLLIPLLLSMGSETVAGAVVSISALGLVAGSLLVATWGGPADRLNGLFLGILGMGIGLGVMGIRPSLAVVVVGILLVHVTHPMAGASSQAIWQSKVPAELQGRVFAVRQMLAIGSAPAAFLLAGTLADNVFNPLLNGDSAISDLLAGLVGGGEGRGIGFMFVLMGLLVAVTVFFAWRHPRIRGLEREVPDIDFEPAPAAA